MAVVIDVCSERKKVEENKKIKKFLTWGLGIAMYRVRARKRDDKAHDNKFGR